MVADGGQFDLLSHIQDFLAASEVHIGGREVVQALVIASVIVVVDEDGDRTFEITGQIIVFKQQTALQGEMLAFDLALGHRMIGLTTRVTHRLTIESIGQFACDVRGTVV